MHVFVSALQHPPLPHAPPAQHASPGPPQSSHLPLLHAVPAAVQKVPPFAVWQQLPVKPPQVWVAFVLFWHTPALQVAVALHALFVALQVPFTQHEPAPAQLLSPQQGPLSAPHAVGVPFEQMLPVVVVWPDATHVPAPLPTQHPPPPHFVVPGQHA